MKSRLPFTHRLMIAMLVRNNPDARIVVVSYKQ